jgi:hypothetical protein
MTVGSFLRVTSQITPRITSTATHKKMIKRAPIPPPIGYAASHDCWSRLQVHADDALPLTPEIIQIRNRTFTARMIQVKTRTFFLAGAGCMNTAG